MDVKTPQSHREKNEDFGLPQDEFKPIESEGEKWFKITAVMIGLILSVGAGVFYWFFYHAPASHLSMETRPTHKEHENKVPAAHVDFKNQDVSTIHQASQKNTQTSKPVKEVDTSVSVGRKGAKDPNRFYADTPQKGTVTKITTPQGDYYVVVGSFIDSDLASDYANRLAQQGDHVILIVPPQGQYFFRVAVEQGSTSYEAKEKATALKARYGGDIWILKY
jgi:SPOR domain